MLWFIYVQCGANSTVCRDHIYPFREAGVFKSSRGATNLLPVLRTEELSFWAYPAPPSTDVPPPPPLEAPPLGGPRPLTRQYHLHQVALLDVSDRAHQLQEVGRRGVRFEEQDLVVKAVEATFGELRGRERDVVTEKLRAAVWNLPRAGRSVSPGNSRDPAAPCFLPVPSQTQLELSRAGQGARDPGVVGESCLPELGRDIGSGILGT